MRLNWRCGVRQWSSAVVNISLWPDNPYPRDFLMQSMCFDSWCTYIYIRYGLTQPQAAIFLGQNNSLDPDTTLYTVFFGINDWLDSFSESEQSSILSSLTKNPTH